MRSLDQDTTVLLLLPCASRTVRVGPDPRRPPPLSRRVLRLSDNWTSTPSLVRAHLQDSPPGLLGLRTSIFASAGTRRRTRKSRTGTDPHSTSEPAHASIRVLRGLQQLVHETEINWHVRSNFFVPLKRCSGFLQMTNDAFPQRVHSCAWERRFGDSSRREVHEEIHGSEGLLKLRDQSSDFLPHSIIRTNPRLYRPSSRRRQCLAVAVLSHTVTRANHSGRPRPTHPEPLGCASSSAIDPS